ncbi:hypothetical protein [Helicobacter felis]|nr:hypothetical protein [Helicobacter felis]
MSEQERIKSLEKELEEMRRKLQKEYERHDYELARLQPNKA